MAQPTLNAAAPNNRALASAGDGPVLIARDLRKLGGVYTHTGDNDHGHYCEWYRYDRQVAA